MLNGKVLWISKRDGNGIIVGEDNNEYYFDSSVSKEFSNITPKMQVTFNLNSKIKDCRCAMNVVTE